MMFAPLSRASMVVLWVCPASVAVKVVIACQAFGCLDHLQVEASLVVTFSGVMRVPSGTVVV